MYDKQLNNLSSDSMLFLKKKISEEKYKHRGRRAVRFACSSGAGRRAENKCRQGGGLAGNATHACFIGGIGLSSSEWPVWLVYWTPISLEACYIQSSSGLPRASTSVPGRWDATLPPAGSLSAKIPRSLARRGHHRIRLQPISFKPDILCFFLCKDKWRWLWEGKQHFKKCSFRQLH